MYSAKKINDTVRYIGTDPLWKGKIGIVKKWEYVQNNILLIGVLYHDSILMWDSPSHLVRVYPNNTYPNLF